MSSCNSDLTSLEQRPRTPPSGRAVGSPASRKSSRMGLRALLRSKGVPESSRAAAGRPAARRTLRGVAAALLALAAFSGVLMQASAALAQERVPSDWELKPKAIDAAGQFRLVFVTRNQPPTSNSDIAAYDMAVQNRVRGFGHMAIRAYEDDFRVLGCTSTVDARTHTETRATDTGVPIYWVGKAKVADDYEDLYDGSWDSNGAQTEAGEGLGSGTDFEVRTGCVADGTARTGGYLGAPTVAVTNARRVKANGLYETDLTISRLSDAPLRPLAGLPGEHRAGVL